VIRQAYRIVREKFAATAFTGEGAALSGGRWNSPGTRVVYTSATASLAALETLVQINPALRFNYLLIPVEFDGSLVEKIPLASLPADWRQEPPPPSTKCLGDAWVKSARSAILELPSAIIPGETNFLLNTTHPDFKSITFGKPEVFAFDPRLIP
jgi:RES domain-containing protein